MTVCKKGKFYKVDGIVDGRLVKQCNVCLRRVL